MTSIWRIIPGEPEYRSTILGKFIREDYVAVGWNPVRDLTGVSEDSLEAIVREDLEQEGWMEEDIVAGIKTFRQFHYQMKKGDIVVVSGDGFVYALGKVTGSYYKEQEPVSMPDDAWKFGFYSYHHRRKVRWLMITKTPFSSLSRKVATKLGTPPTLMKLSMDEWVALSSTLLSMV